MVSSSLKTVILTSLLTAVVVGGVAYWWATRPLPSTSEDAEAVMDVTLTPGDPLLVSIDEKDNLLVLPYALEAGQGCAGGCQLRYGEGTGREFELVSADGIAYSHWVGGIPPGYSGVPGEIVQNITLRPGHRTFGEAYFVVDKGKTDFILEYVGEKWKVDGPINIRL